MRALLSAVFVSTLAFAGPAFAQTPPSQEETSVEDVVVNRTVEQAVRSFVDTVGDAPRDRNLARWDGRICVGATNLAPRYAQAMVDQVSAVALAIGLELEEPGCRADILIVGDQNGDALAQWMVEGEPQVFRPDIGNSNLGREALRRFQTSGAPVRWWHVTQTVSADTGEPATGGATVRVRGASRLRSNIREDMHHVIIILDTTRIGTISFASLADYVSMVALAQVDVEADTAGYDSVLNLFLEGASGTQRMTQWDLDYLRALYAARGDAASDGRQQREIVEQVLRQRDGQPEDSAPPGE